MTAANLIGTMDFSDIGIMGHSRGGEGAATAVSLNAGLTHPWAIKSVFELAPIDFTRDTVPDIPEATLLPYCDGDVSDQQGEHFYADSKSAFADNVLRSDIWVMGTDHDFYNQDWTPPTPGSSDDWTAGRQPATDPVCGEQAPGTSRLTPGDQYQVGAAYLAGWFELTLGGQKPVPVDVRRDGCGTAIGHQLHRQRARGRSPSPAARTPRPPLGDRTVGGRRAHGGDRAGVGPRRHRIVHVHQPAHQHQRDGHGNPLR